MKLKNNNISTPVKKAPTFTPGIDALYYYVLVDFADYTRFYNNILLSRTLEDDPELNLLSYNYDNQFTIFNYFEGNSGPIGDLSIGRISFKNLNQKDNLDFIRIQLDSFYFNLKGLSNTIDLIDNKLKELTIQPLGTKVSRLDLNSYVCNYDFTYLDYSYFSTKAKNNKWICKAFERETYSIGNRDTDSVHLRIYNKKNEMRDNLSNDISKLEYKKMIISERHRVYNGFYPDLDNEPLWNVEFEVKRGILRLYEINTIEDVKNNVERLFLDLTKRTRLLENKKNGDHDSRKKNSSVWDGLIESYKVFNFDDITSLERVKVKQYRKDYNYLINRIQEVLEDKLNDDLKINLELKSLKRLILAQVASNIC